MFRTLFDPCVNCRRPVMRGEKCQPCADRDKEEEMADRLRNESEHALADDVDLQMEAEFESRNAETLDFGRRELDGYHAE